MKKNKLKNLLKCGILLFGISLFTISCQKDDNLSTSDEIENTSNYRIKYLSISDFNTNSKLLDKLNKVKKVETKYNSRDIIHNSEHGFTIDTDIAKYVETVDGTSHSYTFLITRDIPTQITENLVITLQDDGTYQTSIVSYFFPDFDNIGIKNENIDFDSDTVLNQLQLRDCISWYSCEQWSFYCPDCDNNPNEGTWVCDLYTSHEVCDQNATIEDASDGGGGGGGSGSSSGSSGSSGTRGSGSNNGSQWDGTVWTSGGGGGTGTGNTSGNDTNTGTTTTTTTTSPFLGSKRTRKYLKQLVENPTISAKIGELAPKVDSDQSGNLKEDGARFKFISEDNYTIRLPSVKKGSSVDYTPDYEPNETVSVHIHQTKAYKYKQDGTPSDQPLPNSPIYSSQDILEFLENLNYIETTNSDLTEDVASLLISKKPNTPINVNQANIFALVVDSNGDKNDALNAHTALQDDDTYNEFTDYFKDNVLKDWEKVDCDDACVIQSFIDFVNTYEVNGEPLGISIYQYTNFNGTINWIKR